MAQEFLDAVGREQRLPARGVDHIGGQEGEVGAGELPVLEVFVQTESGVRIGRVVAAALHAQQLLAAVVELVIADGIEVEADAVHGLDGRLVMEQRRQQRARADQVARRHHRVQRVRGPQAVDDGGQARHARIAAGGFEIAVEIVEGDQLHRELGTDRGFLRACDQVRPVLGRQLAVL